MRVRRFGVSAAIGVVAVGIGAGVAVAAPNDSETPITGDALVKANAAALAFTGGGTVTQTEVGDEESLYEVEVMLGDGSQVDVQLDQNFVAVGNKADPPGTDTDPDSDGDGGSPR